MPQCRKDDPEQQEQEQCADQLDACPRPQPPDTMVVSAPDKIRDQQRQAQEPGEYGIKLHLQGTYA